MGAQVNVTATMRVVATIKGNTLFTERYETSFKLANGIMYPNGVVNALADSEARVGYVEVFIERLRKDSVLKRQIGGTKWSVEVINLNYEVEGEKSCLQ